MTRDERAATVNLAALQRVLSRQFKRAVYYRQPRRLAELRSAIQKVRRSLLLRQEFEYGTSAGATLTINDVLRRYS